MNTKKIMKKFVKSIDTRTPEILTGMGIGGFFVSVCLAVKATPKAERILEEKRRDSESDLTKKEVIQATWSCYVPAAATFIASTSLVICSGSISKKRTAAMAAAYHLSEEMLNEYKNKVVEIVGEKKANEINTEVSRSRMEKDYSSNLVNGDVIETGLGNQLFYDPWTKTKFRCDVNSIKAGINYLNSLLNTNDEACMNDLYSEIRLGTCIAGSDYGWEVNDVLKKAGHRLLEWDPGVTIMDDQAVTIIGFNVRPEMDYDRRYR